MVAAYTALGDLAGGNPMNIGAAERERIEQRAADAASWFIIDGLPRTPAAKQALIETGLAMAKRMSWDVVACERMLPALGL